MCGICCILGPDDNDMVKNYECLIKSSFLPSRGPDCCSYLTAKVNEKQILGFHGSVLHMRGEMIPQPLKDACGNILLWNGEIFGGIKVGDAENDSKILLNQLALCHCAEDILTEMSSIKGPWAFVYWQESLHKLWFGRDVFGRRSLLWYLPQCDNDVLLLCSVRLGHLEFEEMPAVGIFCLEINDTKNFEPLRHSIQLYPWDTMAWPLTGEFISNNLEEKMNSLQVSSNTIKVELGNNRPKSFLPVINRELPPTSYKLADIHCSFDQYLEELLCGNEEMSVLADQFVVILGNAVKLRVLNQNKDFLTHANRKLKCQKNYQHLTIKKGSHSKERCYSSYRQKESQQLDSGIQDNKRSLRPEDEQINENDDGDDERKMLHRYINLESNVGRLFEENDMEENLSSVAILFSGGIDSAILAVLADRYVPQAESIDLLNVAFEPHATSTHLKMSKDRHERNHEKTASFCVPDRLTGYAALKELNPCRKWNFVEVNVTLEELQTCRSQHVRHLVYPLKTTLDDSIGCALWFAARGQGILVGPDLGKNSSHFTKAKVLLCGIGADELLAGYSRHRVCFKEQGWEGLINEIQTDINRLSSRNLGRDDRIISDHGREARFPFLDEDVVSFLSHLPVYKKVDLNLPRGLGEKLLLRLCAHKLGLKNACVLPKRAIQFGSRIAKLEKKKEKATDVCDRL